MQVQIINKSPRNWLEEIGESPAKVAEVLDSFGGESAPRVCAYRAPHLFLRFHGAKATKRIYQPNYWVDGSAVNTAFNRSEQFENWLTEAEIARTAKGHYRDISAICHNWNDLRDNELWKIELRGGESIEGLEGPAAPQPQFAATGVALATISKLRGGAIQIYLNPRSPFICTPVNWGAA
jgi:hypothetical protein